MSGGTRRRARLADLIEAAIEPALAERGFQNAAILRDWAAIAGPHLAAVTRPLGLSWPPRPKAARAARAAGATLTVAVRSGAALELQMSAAQLIERANARLGFGAVEKLSIRQQPVVAPAPPRARPQPPPREIAEAVARRTADISDPDLRRALTRLGAEVTARARRGTLTNP